MTQLRLHNSVKWARGSGLLQLRQDGLAVSNLFQPFFIHRDSTSISSDCLVSQVCSSNDIQLLVPKGHACSKVPGIVTLRVIVIFFRKENNFSRVTWFPCDKKRPHKMQLTRKGDWGEMSFWQLCKAAVLHRDLPSTSTARRVECHLWCW